MSPRRHRRWSGITVTDQFCGAGGSTLGAKRAGVEVRLAMNHWERAVRHLRAGDEKRAVPSLFDEEAAVA